MFDLTGKCALVTGASGGIGGGIARALHGAGAAVVLSGTRREALDELAAELSVNGADRVAVVTCNLSDAEEVGGLIAAAGEALAPIDILINNAGLTRDSLAMRLKDENWDAVISVNLTSAFRLSKASLRHMMKSRWGRIINITSVVATTGNPGQANYAAAKAGMVGMSKSLAQEVASRGITVNCLAPGFIATAMTDSLSDQQREAILAKVPCGKLGSPEDIAAGALYLASPQAAYVTGQTLHINGGLAMI